MATKYRVNFNAGGYTETMDLDEAKALKAVSPATILAINIQWKVNEDPQLRLFESYDAAYNAAHTLQDEIFYVDSNETVADPQPEGLND